MQGFKQHITAMPVWFAVCVKLLPSREDQYAFSSLLPRHGDKRAVSAGKTAQTLIQTRLKAAAETRLQAGLCTILACTIHCM